MAVFVFAVHIDTGREVFFDRRNGAVLGRDKNGLGRRFIVPARHPGLAQKIRQLSLGLAAGKVERSAPFLVLRREIGLGLYQLLGCLELIVLGRVVQRCLFAFAPEIDVRAVGQCEGHHRSLSLPDRSVQDRVTVLVLIVNLVFLG